MRRSLRITFADEAEFQLARGAVSAMRARAFANWQTTTGDEQAFHSDLTDRCDRLALKFDALLAADTSQDAEPDEEEGDGDDR
jgi:hypothetical protein